MGASISTARWIAPASFLIDFAAQQYGMLSSPNMKDVHDANLSFFSPQPYFIAGFFFPQQLFQLAWLYRMWRLDASKPEQRRELEGMADFAPYYAVGNLCIATWMIFWNASDLKTANVFVIINTLTQLYYMTRRLPTMDTSSWGSILTHVVAKTFAGIGVLDLLHNTSVAYFKDQMPSTVVQVLTGVGFASAGLASDWIFGGCLAYDLVALSVGQRSYNVAWSQRLAGFAAATGAVVGLKNWFRPPYVKGETDQRGEYGRAPEIMDEEEAREER